MSRHALVQSFDFLVQRTKPAGMLAAIDGVRESYDQDLYWIFWNQDQKFSPAPARIQLFLDLGDRTVGIE
jgi:hypothetical protein